VSTNNSGTDPIFYIIALKGHSDIHDFTEYLPYELLEKQRIDKLSIIIIIIIIRIIIIIIIT
jgi:hypothetical protein